MAALLMNQLCKVCGEPAAGFHFGAFTCEGCKSFFGRTYNNISAIAGCKNNGDCVINKKNRTACKACRLRKCLLVGMSKSGSRYGRRSNWFKIHCLLQEQQQTQQGGNGANTIAGGGGGNGGNGVSNFEQLARLHQMQARQTYQDKTNPCIKTASMSNTPPPAPTSSSSSLPPPPPAPSTFALQHHHTPSHQPAHSQSSTSTSSTPTHPATPNFLAAAKFFNGVDMVTAAAAAAAAAAANNHHHHHVFKFATNAESRLSDTPSDSGASSAAEPDEATDDARSTISGHVIGKDTRNRHSLTTMSTAAATAAAHQSLANTIVMDDVDVMECERRRKQLLQIFRSHSEPLHSPFGGSFSIGNLPPPPILTGGTTPAYILPALREEMLKRHERTNSTGTPPVSGTNVSTQEEPIDLSVKSLTAVATKHSETCHSPSEQERESQRGHINSASLSPKHTADALSMLHTAAITAKTTPLDLTLVRPQTLTG